MSLRSLNSGLLLILAACGATSSTSAEDGAQAAAQPSAAPPFTTAEVATFTTPWAMDFLPGSGRRMTSMALVTEREGRLWLIDVTNGRKQPVSGVPQAKVAGQGGLGDVVVHPDFAGNQRVYLSYAEPGPDGTSGAAVGYGRLLFTSAAAPGAPAGVSLDGFKVIWRQEPKVSGNGHFGHRIAFAPDGTMFVTSGDRQKMQPAQDPNSDLGKIIHMTAEGQRLGGRFYSMGHRNSLGIAFDGDGRLWSIEMGPRHGDELNLIAKGRNYGWPEVSYGGHYEGADIPDRHAPRFEEPKLWWNPAISPGGMIIYTGDLFRQWKGDALIGGLSGQNLVRADIDGDKARKADDWPMGARIRAVDQGPDGAVYLLEDGRSPGQGRLLRLTPAR